MKQKLTRFTVILFALFIMADDVFGVLGTRRRTQRRTAVVVGSSVHAADMASMNQSQQQSAQAQPQSSTEQQAPAPAQPPAAAPASTPPPSSPPPTATGKKLPEGTVVTSLPAGATATPVDGVQYYYAGGNFYRAVFQGNQLVYVTAEPK